MEVLDTFVTAKPPAISRRQAYTSLAMDRECAFCGRADAASRQVLCDDCHGPHRVCTACAESVVSDGTAVEAESYPQAA